MLAFPGATPLTAAVRFQLFIMNYESYGCYTCLIYFREFDGHTFRQHRV